MGVAVVAFLMPVRSCAAVLREASRAPMRDFACALLWRKRQLSLPVSTIWQWWVSRSKSAVGGVRRKTWTGLFRDTEFLPVLDWAE